MSSTAMKKEYSVTAGDRFQHPETVLIALESMKTVDENALVCVSSGVRGYEHWYIHNLFMYEELDAGR